MRLKMRVLAGMIVVLGLALSLPAKTKDVSKDEGARKPSKLSHLMPFHKSTHKATKDHAEGTLATAAQSEVRRHTNGFPEADKKGPENQPQATNQQWADDNWKTSQNKDTFKHIETK
jgi:hypothetical protein